MSALWPFHLGIASFFPVEEYITLSTGCELQNLWAGILAGQYQDSELAKQDYTSQLRLDAQMLRPIDYPALYAAQHLSRCGEHISTGIRGIFKHPLTLHPLLSGLQQGRPAPTKVPPSLMSATPQQLSMEMRCLLPDLPVTRGAPCLTARNAYIAGILSHLAYKHRPSALYRTLYRAGWDSIVNYSVSNTEFLYLSKICADPEPQVPVEVANVPGKYRRSPIGRGVEAGKGTMSISFVVVRGTESVTDASYDALFAGPLIRVPAFLAYGKAFERTNALAHMNSISGGDLRLASLLWHARTLDPTYKSGATHPVEWFHRRLAMAGVAPVPMHVVEAALLPCDETEGHEHHTEFLHAGFIIAAKIILRTIAHRRNLPMRDRKVFYLAGHSLGGALACATARVLRACFGGAVAGVYTFGAAHLSTPQATRGLLPWSRHFHFVHGADIVADASPVGLIGSVQKEAFASLHHYSPLRYPRTNSPGIFVKPEGFGIVWPHRYRSMMNVCKPWTVSLVPSQVKAPYGTNSTFRDVLASIPPDSRVLFMTEVEKFKALVAAKRAGGVTIKDSDLDHCGGMPLPSPALTASHGIFLSRFVSSVRDNSHIDIDMIDLAPSLEGKLTRAPYGGGTKQFHECEKFDDPESHGILRRLLGRRRTAAGPPGPSKRVFGPPLGGPQNISFPNSSTNPVYVATMTGPHTGPFLSGQPLAPRGPPPLHYGAAGPHTMLSHPMGAVRLPLSVGTCTSSMPLPCGPATLANPHTSGATLPPTTAAFNAAYSGRDILKLSKEAAAGIAASIESAGPNGCNVTGVPPIRIPQEFVVPVLALHAGHEFAVRPCKNRRFRALGGVKRFLTDHKMHHYLAGTRHAWLVSLSNGQTVPSRPVAMPALSWTTYPSRSVPAVMGLDGARAVKPLLQHASRVGVPDVLKLASGARRETHHDHSGPVSDDGEPTVPPTAYGLAPGHMHLPGPRLAMRIALGDYGHHDDVDMHARGLMHQYVMPEATIATLWTKMLERRALIAGDMLTARIAVDLVVPTHESLHPRKWVQEFWSYVGIAPPSPLDRPGVLIGPVPVDEMVEFDETPTEHHMHYQ